MDCGCLTNQFSFQLDENFFQLPRVSTSALDNDHPACIRK